MWSAVKLFSDYSRGPKGTLHTRMPFPLSSKLQFNRTSMRKSILNCPKVIKKEKNMLNPKTIYGGFNEL